MAAGHERRPHPEGATNGLGGALSHTRKFLGGFPTTHTYIQSAGPRPSGQQEEQEEGELDATPRPQGPATAASGLSKPQALSTTATTRCQHERHD